jgi:hypothetical protein
MTAADAEGCNTMGALRRAGTDRPPGRSLDPRRLKPVPGHLSLSMLAGERPPPED